MPDTPPVPTPLPHRFRLQRGDWELELEGARDYVEAQITRLLPLLLAGASATEPAAPAPSETAAEAEPFPRVPADFSPQTRTSLAEFVEMKAASTPSDVLAVAAYYLEKYRRTPSFSLGELAALLRELPAWDERDLAEPLELCLLQGLLEAVRDGRYTTTFKGQNYVRDGLA